MEREKSTWQPIPTGGADFNEIWDDTELIKAFSKSINYYKKMHDPNRKEEEMPLPEEGEDEYDVGSRMDESETQVVAGEAMTEASEPSTPARKEDVTKKIPTKRKSSATSRKLIEEGEEEVEENGGVQTSTATQQAADLGPPAASPGYDYSSYWGSYYQPQYHQYPGANAEPPAAQASPSASKKVLRKKKSAAQAAPSYDYYPASYPQGHYGAPYPYGPPGYPISSAGPPMMPSPAYPIPPIPHYHFHPVPHVHSPHHPYLSHHQPPPPPPPPGIDDEALKDLLNAWYYSGYYAGRYQVVSAVLGLGKQG